MTPTPAQIDVVVADARAQAGQCPPDTRSEVIVWLDAHARDANGVADSRWREMESMHGALAQQIKRVAELDLELATAREHVEALLTVIPFGSVDDDRRRRAREWLDGRPTP